MITEWFVSIGTSVAAWFATIFPTWDIPASMTNPGGVIAGIWANFNGLSPWVNWAVLTAVVVGVLGTYLVMFTIKLVRAIASYLPFFGGAG